MSKVYCEECRYFSDRIEGPYCIKTEIEWFDDNPIRRGHEEETEIGEDCFTYNFSNNCEYYEPK